MPDPAEGFSESRDEPREETSTSLVQLASTPTDMALRVSTEAVSEDPRNPEKHFKLADIYRRRQQFDKAEEEYKAAIRLDPRNDAYHWSLGQLYEYDRKNLVLAEAAYRDAVRLSPQSLDSNFCLARVYEKQGKLAQAEGLYSQLAELDPAYREAFARVCERQGKTSVAGEEYGKLTWKPQTAFSFLAEHRNTVVIAAVIVVALLFALMYLYFEKEKNLLLTQNANLKKQVGTIGPSEEESRLRTDLQEAKSQLEEALRERDALLPSSEAVQHLAAASKHLSNDKPADTIRELEAYLKTDPDNPVICDALGDLYRSTNNISKAKDYYHRAARQGYKEASDTLKFIDLKKSTPTPKPTPQPTPTPKYTPPPKPRPVPKPTPTPEPKVSLAPVKADLGRVLKDYEYSVLESRSGVKSYGDGAALAVSKKTIQEFVAALTEYEEKDGFGDTGAFLSGLIANLPDKDSIALDLGKLKRKIHYLGAHLRDKNLSIKGNAGLFLGRSMESGTITLYGHASGNAGHSMAGGEIIIKGNARDSVGYFMRGGKITVEENVGNKAGDCMEEGKIIVKGDAGGLVGQKMTGGEIFLEGRYKSLARTIKDGRIYHRGKKIFPERRR